MIRRAFIVWGLATLILFAIALIAFDLGLALAGDRPNKITIALCCAAIALAVLPPALDPAIQIKDRQTRARRDRRAK